MPVRKRNSSSPTVIRQLSVNFPFLDSKGNSIEDFVPPQPPKSFRVILDLHQPAKRLDSVLLAALKEQKENLEYREISRAKFKALFTEGKVMIKGQNATPKSALAKGVTYVDILK